MPRTLQLIYVPESFPQQSETFVVSEIRGLEALGHTVRIVPRLRGSADAWGDPRCRALRESLVAPTRLPLHLRALPTALYRGSQVWPGRRLRALWRHWGSVLEIARLVGRIRRQRADAIVCHFGYDNAIASAIAGKQMGIPVVLWLHGSDIYGQPHRSLEWISENVSQIVTNSAYSRELILSLGVKAPVAVSCLGVDLDLFSNPGSGKKEPRPTVISVGRLGHNKNQERLLRVFKRVLDAVPGAVLQLVGSGPNRPRLEDVARGLAISDSVRFVRAKDSEAVAELMRRAWIFALLSDKEGLGVAFLEAQACGLPCVGAKVGGVPEAVADGETGFLIDFHQPEAEVRAAQRVVELLTDAALSERMGRAATAFACERFDGSRHVAAMDRILRTVSRVIPREAGAAPKFEARSEGGR